MLHTTFLKQLPFTLAFSKSTFICSHLIILAKGFSPCSENYLHLLEKCLYTCACSVAPSCLILCDHMDCSPPGSSVHGISQQEYWNGLPFFPLRDILHVGTEPRSPASSALAGRLLITEPPGKTKNVYDFCQMNKEDPWTLKHNIWIIIIVLCKQTHQIYRQIFKLPSN